MLLRTGFCVLLLTLVACGGQPRVETWPDGSTKASGLTRVGFLHGEWSFFHPGGALQARGSYLRDKQVGLWTWWDADGQELQRGSYRTGMREGWWIYRHPGGALKAVGAYRADRQDGPWRFTDPAGQITAVGSFERGARSGLWVFRDAGEVRETGCYLDGRRVGPWLNSGERGLDMFVHGVPEGWSLLLASGDRPLKWLLQGPDDRRIAVAWPSLVVDQQGGRTAFTAHDPDGSLITGVLPQDESEQRWLRIQADGTAQELVVWSGGARLSGPVDPGVHAAPDQGALPDAGGLTDAGGETLNEVVTEIQVAVAFLLDSSDRGELRAPPEAPVPDPAAAPTTVELSPTVAPPMTPMDQRKLELSEQVYRDGGSFGYGHGEIGGSAARLSRLRQDLIGQPLVQTRFLDGSGNVVDLADYRGKRNLVLVVMRGFAGSVCPYCSGQTRALISRAADFAARDAELLVCYPGAASSVPQFVEAVTGASDGELPLDLLLDLDLGFVRAAGIESDLAAPSTFIVDRAGVVRYCYQGLDLTDRPSVPEMLRQLDRIEAPGDG